ncbi:MAG: GFA family protein [Pseudooceanicola sp.]
MIEGRCLCGSVTIRVGDHRPGIGACHCGMCRRWTGSVYMMFTAPADQVAVEGEVRRYRSSGFAERAFCPTCGSNLWLRDDDADYEFMPGLFEAAREYPLISEVYADQAMTCLRLSGNHMRETRADYEAKNPFVPEGGMS